MTCVGAHISMMVVSGQGEGGKCTVYGLLQLRITSTAATLLTLGVMLFLKCVSFLALTELKGREEEKRFIVLVYYILYT